MDRVARSSEFFLVRRSESQSGFSAELLRIIMKFGFGLQGDMLRWTLNRPQTLNRRNF